MNNLTSRTVKWLCIASISIYLIIAVCLVLISNNATAVKLISPQNLTYPGHQESTFRDFSEFDRNVHEQLAAGKLVKNISAHGYVQPGGSEMGVRRLLIKLK